MKMKTWNKTVYVAAAACALMGCGAAADDTNAPGPEGELDKPEQQPEGDPPPIMENGPGTQVGGDSYGGGVFHAQEASVMEVSAAAAKDAVRLTSKGPYPSWHYLTANGTWTLPSRNTHYCALNMIGGTTSGSFTGRVRYFSNGTQALDLYSSSGVTVGSYCIDKSNFFTWTNPSISQVFDTKYSLVAPKRRQTNYPPYDDQVTWFYEEWGNALAGLGGVGGRFWDLNDFVQVEQGPTQNHQNVTRIGAAAEDAPAAGYITGYSTAFWINETGPQGPIRLAGQDAWIRNGRPARCKSV